MLALYAWRQARIEGLKCRRDRKARKDRPIPSPTRFGLQKIATGQIEEDTGDSNKDKAAQALGRKGGAARREKLSPERRAEIAKKAAAKRWSR